MWFTFSKYSLTCTHAISVVEQNPTYVQVRLGSVICIPDNTRLQTSIQKDSLQIRLSDLNGSNLVLISEIPYTCTHLHTQISGGKQLFFFF